MTKHPSAWRRPVLKNLAPPVLLLAALILLWPKMCLTAESRGALYLAWPISAGDRLEVTFTHSLNLSPITDVIEWTGHDFAVRKSVFKAFGAGVPVPADGDGTALVRVGGHYELIGLDRHLPGFTIMTQEIPDHRLALNGREARLADLAGPGQAVTIAVRRVPRWRAMLHS